jgi:SAM-dependent methyltransferase
MSSPIDDHTTIFRRSWSVYDAITAENYMFHRELYSEVAAILERRHGTGDYSVLDLGCGSARFLAPSLQSAPPVSYTGVDLSPVALTEAQDYLAGLGGVSLHESDMVEFAAESVGGYDVIFSGFAMHHLNAAAKAALFSHCARALAPGGFFLLVDVLREEGQTREEYLDGYLGMMHGEWNAVAAEMIDEACDHVAAHDDPASLSELSEFATAAGLATVSLLAKHRQHHLIRFER